MSGSHNKRLFFFPYAIFLFFSHSAEGRFEPYTLNGGLVAAVAGRNFVVLATDTRMTDGGYEILTRKHVESRLYTVHPISSNMFVTEKEHEDDDDDTSSSTLLFQQDGSIALPPIKKDDKTSSSVTAVLSSKAKLPVLMASCGCTADCDALKRILRNHVRGNLYTSSTMDLPSQVATLVGQILYLRRMFPYYAFCCVAGLEGSKGVAYTYDAIGSYEQVAVATAGTGKELLQPILDRLFLSTKNTEQNVDEGTSKDNEEAGGGMIARKFTTVDCSMEETISILHQAYRSVSERDIGVGDRVVMSVLFIDPQEGNTVKMKVIHFPLKEH